MCRQAVIAANGVRPTHLQFADFTVGHRLPLFVDDAHFVIGAQRPALGVQDQLLAVIQARVAEQPLSHAQHLLQGAAEYRRDPRRRGAQQLRPADLEHTQARQIGLALGLGVEPEHCQRWHQRGDGHPLCADQGEAGVRVGAPAAHHPATRQQGTDHAGAAQGEVVRHGQGGKVHGVLVQAADGAAGAHVVEVFSVPARNQLGGAGGAARQLEAGHCLGLTGVMLQCFAAVQLA
ncbi:hypothetical protein D3C85_1133150 [compost metagenome]